LRGILCAHQRFLAFCTAREYVLTLVEHLFPPPHRMYTTMARALFGDPLAAFRLLSDDVCCRLCERLGDTEFAQKSAGRACTDFFYGASLKALVAGDGFEKPRHGRKSQWLSLDEWCRIVDLPLAAQAFMASARALGVPPRIARKLDACEARFRVNWGQVLKALQGVEVDTREVLLVHMMLRCILPGDVAKLVLDMYARFPMQIDDAHGGRERKRRRRV